MISNNNWIFFFYQPNSLSLIGLKILPHLSKVWIHLVYSYHSFFFFGKNIFKAFLPSMVRLCLQHFPPSALIVIHSSILFTLSLSTFLVHIHKTFSSKKVKSNISMYYHSSQQVRNLACKFYSLSHSPYSPN